MKDCIFCKIVNKEVPCDMVYEDEQILAFRDIDPKAPVHVLIIPKKHIASLMKVDSGNIDLIVKIHITAQHLARELGINDKGFRVVNNCGKDGGQSVDHLHYHLLGGRQLQWPPG